MDLDVINKQEIIIDVNPTLARLRVCLFSQLVRLHHFVCLITFPTERGTLLWSANRCSRSALIFSGAKHINHLIFVRFAQGTRTLCSRVRSARFLINRVDLQLFDRTSSRVLCGTVCQIIRTTGDTRRAARCLNRSRTKHIFQMRQIQA